MSFTVFQNSTTADATEVNANFYFVAQGSRLPMTQTAAGSLTAVDATYDLGSATYTWNNLFCENIYINGTITTVDKKLKILVAEVTLSTGASSIEFTGLNGDADLEYEIILSVNGSATSEAPLLIINGDSAANYGHQYIKALDTVTSAVRTTYSYIPCASPYNKNHCFMRGILNTKTGIARMMIHSHMNGISGTLVTDMVNWVSVWNNTADTITSLKFYDNGAINWASGTHIEIWKRG
jgi:hypothetical protein